MWLPITVTAPPSVASEQKHRKGKLLVHERSYRYHLRTFNSGPTPTPALFPRCTYSRKKPTRALQCIQSRVNLGPFTVL